MRWRQIGILHASYYGKYEACVLIVEARERNDLRNSWKNKIQFISAGQWLIAIICVFVYIIYVCVLCIFIMYI